MGTAAAHRERMWAEAKANPQKATPDQQRVKEFQPFKNTGTWAVCRVYDDGRPSVVVRDFLTANAAPIVAGEMRDGMSDTAVAVAVAEGWNYGPVRVRGPGKAKVAR